MKQLLTKVASVLLIMLVLFAVLPAMSPALVAAEGCQYIIQSGESLDTVASRFGVTRQQLLDWNPNIFAVPGTSVNVCQSPVPVVAPTPPQSAQPAILPPASPSSPVVPQQGPTAPSGPVYPYPIGTPSSEILNQYYKVKIYGPERHQPADGRIAIYTAGSIGAGGLAFGEVVIASAVGPYVVAGAAVYAAYLLVDASLRVFDHGPVVTVNGMYAVQQWAAAQAPDGYPFPDHLTGKADADNRQAAWATLLGEWKNGRPPDKCYEIKTSDGRSTGRQAFYSSSEFRSANSGKWYRGLAVVFNGITGSSTAYYNAPAANPVTVLAGEILALVNCPKDPPLAPKF